MERNVIESGAPASSMPVDAGRWVAVDQNNLGFSVPSLPNGQPVQGPDGAIYCVGKSQDVVAPIAGNANNAIPTPSGIVQLPPIVQPIALVPYTSQNQPLLQYDPYSRPVEPQAAPKAPVYIRKPYKGISIAAMIMAIIGLVALVVLCVLTRAKENFAGYDVIAGIAHVIKIEGVSVKYDSIFAVLGDNATGNIVLSILPFIVLAIAVIYLCLAIKYLVKLAQGKSPRCVSVLAIVNLILTIAVAALGLVALKIEDGRVLEKIIGDYLMNSEKVIISMGIGVIISFVASIVLIILPLCPKKNAYMVEKDPSKESYPIN